LDDVEDEDAALAGRCFVDVDDKEDEDEDFDPGFGTADAGRLEGLDCLEVADDDDALAAGFALAFAGLSESKSKESSSLA
jgi:hypothetical protein